MTYEEFKQQFRVKDWVYNQQLKEIADVNKTAAQYINGEVTLNQYLLNVDTLDISRRILYSEDRLRV